MTKPYSPARLRRMVEAQAGRYGITAERMLAHQRPDADAYAARLALICEARGEGVPFEAIGAALNRNHSSCIHAYRKALEA